MKRYIKLIPPMIIFVFIISTLVCCQKTNTYWDQRNPVIPYRENVAGLHK